MLRKTTGAWKSNNWTAVDNQPLSSGKVCVFLGVFHGQQAERDISIERARLFYNPKRKV